MRKTKTSLFFPGQGHSDSFLSFLLIQIEVHFSGSQRLKMGWDLAQNFPIARHVFEEVDAALKQKLSSVIWGAFQLDPPNFTLKMLTCFRFG